MDQLRHAAQVLAASNAVEDLYADPSISWRGRLWLGRISLWLLCEHLDSLGY